MARLHPMLFDNLQHSFAQTVLSVSVKVCLCATFVPVVYANQNDEHLLIKRTQPTAITTLPTVTTTPSAINPHSTPKQTTLVSRQHTQHPNNTPKTEYHQPVANAHATTTASTTDSTATPINTTTATLPQNTDYQPTTIKRSHPLNATDATGAAQQLEALTQLYQASDEMCHGTWVYPTQAPKRTDGTLYASATHGYYDNQAHAELSGNVIVSQYHHEIQANALTHNLATGESHATGQVLFGSTETPASTSNTTALLGIAQSLQYNTKTGQANANHVAFASNQLHAHGYADSLSTQTPNQYDLNQVIFSTCAPNARKWELNAKHITLDTASGRGISKNTTLKVKGVPVFYLPYFNFPIDDRRSSGFLLPSLGFNSDAGVEVSTPYYFNLAPNYDATLTPTFYPNKNPLITGEFRYLTGAYGGGRIDAGYLYKDRQYQHQNRSHLFFDHLWRSTRFKNLEASASYRYVSDSDYLSDFDNLGLENNTLNLPWRISTSYFNNQLSANLRVEGYHHLDGTDSSGNAVMDKDRPYNRLPQLSIEYLAPTERWGGDLTNFRLGATHNTAYFKKSIKDGSDTEKSGVRMYNQLFASRPFLHSWGYVTPKVAITNLLMSYDEDSLAGQNLSKEDGRFSVTLPSFSLDTGVYLQKQGAPFGLTDATGGYQILSPRLKYVYSPYKNQSDMPIFDTSVASISYDQLLADTWFLGYDRLADLHAITPALNYRYIDNQGLTRIDASIAEQYYLDDVNVSINNTTFTDSSSGLAWQASIQPKQDFWLDAQGSFTQNYALDTLVLAARYQPKANTLFNVGVIERKQNDALGQLALSAYTASALFPINNKWQVVAQGQYDVNRNLFMDALFGINYEDCCLGMSIYARHYRNELYPEQEPNRAIMAEVRLTGLAGKGRLNRLLSERILGFESIRNTWQGNR